GPGDGRSAVSWFVDGDAESRTTQRTDASKVVYPDSKPVPRSQTRYVWFSLSLSSDRGPVPTAPQHGSLATSALRSLVRHARPNYDVGPPSRSAGMSPSNSPT